MPKLSVIIPCYNHGHYIRDAVNSVLNQSFQDIEIIIVNDGSTDSFTLKELSRFPVRTNFYIIHTANQGPASARNIGIEASKGKYILALDADDIIGRNYAKEAVKILDNNPEIGIVYCKAELFGRASGIWNLPEYCIEEILINNIIICSGVFRKDHWLNVGGYSSKMHYGWEDYDFWLSLIELGVSVYRIPQVLFYYRIVENSRTINGLEAEKKQKMVSEIFIKHRKIYKKNIRRLCNNILCWKMKDLFREIISVKYSKIPGWLSQRGKLIQEKGIGYGLMIMRQNLRKNDCPKTADFISGLILVAKICYYSKSKYSSPLSFIRVNEK